MKRDTKIQLVKDGTLDSTPHSYGLEWLKEKHPDIKLYLSATRRSDGVKFKAGDWVNTPSGGRKQIIAFDHYNYPLPIHPKDKPLGQFRNGPFLHTVYKQKHRKIVRAIFSGGSTFTFHDIEGYAWAKEYGIN